MTEKEYFSPKELAELLSVDRKTIFSLINSGRIRATNMASGSRALYRISREELNRFTNNKQEYGSRHTKHQKTGRSRGKSVPIHQ